MYAEHPVFHTPDGDAVVWRYMDFTKFVSLLDRRALFFARAHKLGDPFEGTMTRANLEERSQLRGKAAPHGAVSVMQAFPEGAKAVTMTRRNYQRMTLISSWHLGGHESAAMWKLYLTGDEGVAVRSTVADLCAALEGFKPDIHIGAVNYIDYDRTPIPERNFFFPFVHKRKSFEHEQELRVVLPRTTDPLRMANEVVPVPDGGEYVPVDLGRLVRGVYVAPTAPLWQEDLVRSVIDRYGFYFEVVRSRLGDDPIF